MEPIRWRADKGGLYHYISDGHVCQAHWGIDPHFEGDSVSNERWRDGNCFSTEVQAEEALVRVKAVLDEYRKEIGE